MILSEILTPTEDEKVWNLLHSSLLGEQSDSIHILIFYL